MNIKKEEEKAMSYLNIRINGEFMDKLKEKSKQKGCSTSSAVKIILKKWVDGEIDF